MNYKESIIDTLTELRNWRENLAELQEDMFIIMSGIDDDIGFAMANKDTDHAEFMQKLFDDLRLITDAVIPRTLQYCDELITAIKVYMWDSEHEEKQENKK
ncbi:MAG: hypothetical protein DRP50_05320 [Thermotoga sp.]|nr:MAG: hypothetical protein DRP50_05320 [Thermotoga sp.]